jgi:hypothetical protein
MKNSNDAGNVIVEFIGVVTALIIPITIISSTSVLISRSYIATEVASRAASRAYIVSDTESAARKHAQSAVKLSLQDQGIFDNSVLTKISCNKSPCLSPGGYVTVSVQRQVLVSLPASLGSRKITIKAASTSVVDELR